MVKKCVICGSEKDLVKIGKYTYRICVDCVSFINQAQRNQQVHCVSGQGSSQDPTLNSEFLKKMEKADPL
jgi:hypothetical protein